MTLRLLAALLCLVALPAAAQPTSATLDAVRARGQLVCGVSGESPGFSLPDSRGEMQGMDADMCRAVAAAALGDAKRVRFVPLSPQARFTGAAVGRDRPAGAQHRLDADAGGLARPDDGLRQLPRRHRLRGARERRASPRRRSWTARRSA
jgi:hypothetical protein